MVKSGTLSMNGATLDYVRFGSGSRNLLILPGLSLRGVKGAAHSLAFLYRRFAKEYTVYILDKRTEVPDGFTIRDLADDVANAAAQLQLARTCVFGVSQGGMIAQHLAIDHPELVEKLALGVTASRVNPVMEQAVNGWIQMAEQDDYRALVLDIFHKMYSPRYLKKYRWLFPILTRLGKPKDMSRFVALAGSCLTCETYPLLSKITCPVLVLGGTQDAVLTGKASEELAEALHSQLVMYPQLGHAAYEEASDFNERIYQFFIQSVSAARNGQ